jgi:hypothetical protein
MGQLNSVTIPATYKDIITPDDRVFSHLRIFVTQKYHYSEDDHHYSLVRRKIHGTLAITSTDLYLFRHRSLILHVKLADERYISNLLFFLFPLLFLCTSSFVREKECSSELFSHCAFY